MCRKGSKAKKEEDVQESKIETKEDPQSSDEEGLHGDSEDAELRDIIYKLEKLGLVC